MIYSILMFGDAQSMSLIQSYKMGRRFLSGNVDHIVPTVMYILLYWPMANVHHIAAHYVLPQYHLVFDDCYAQFRLSHDSWESSCVDSPASLFGSL